MLKAAFIYKLQDYSLLLPLGVVSLVLSHFIVQEFFFVKNFIRFYEFIVLSRNFIVFSRNRIVCDVIHKNLVPLISNNRKSVKNFSLHIFISKFFNRDFLYINLH